MLSYLATVAVRAAIKFAAEHGLVEIGNATKVKSLRHSIFTNSSRTCICLNASAFCSFCSYFVCLPVSSGLVYFLSFCSKNLQTGYQY